MATLSALVQAQLQADTTLAALLARWDGLPAVFLNSAPDADSPLWGAAEYPRIIVRESRTWDASRQTDGVLRFFVDALETDQDAVQTALETEMASRVWHSSDDPFPLVSRMRDEDLPALPLDPDAPLFEATLTADLLALVSLATFAPDPVQAAIDWSTTAFAGLLQTDPATWGATDALPGLYWTVNSWDAGNYFRAHALGQYEQVWLVDLRAHVFHPNAQTRLAAARTVAEALAYVNALRMNDGSLMRMDRRPRIDPNADPIRDGQVQAGFGFRTLSAPVAVQPLRTVVLGEGDVPLTAQTATP